MQYDAPACQLGDARTGDSPQKSTPELHQIRVPDAQQWISTTAGRIAPDPYSWMQAVHWIHGSGLYTPSRTHGPRWGDTTIRLAQELSALKECRPGIAYLTRKLGASARTVKYHLAMLREAGLLAYRMRGSRITGSIRQASEYERIIPTEFDQALGIRTVGEGVQRRPVGIAEEHRGTIGTLARKAARKVRRKRSKKASSTRSRCTPMQDGSTGSSSAGSTHSPSESKLASGSRKSPTPKKPISGKRPLNKVGRRHQLGRELTQRVWWLNHANPARVSWIARHVSDAGWTTDEVIAWINLLADPAIAHRPTGFLAARLHAAVGAVGWATPEQRALQVEADRDTRRAEHHRHAETDSDWQAPSSPNIVARAFAGLRQGMAAYSARQRSLGLDDLSTPNAPAVPAPPHNDPAQAVADLAAFLGLETTGATA